MAALRDNNPLAYINQETEDYRKNRDEMFNQEIEKEIMEKFQVYDDDLERKRQQIEKYREEEELSLIEQYELLQQRREALEAKKEQAEKRWNKQRHQSEDNSKNFESKPFEGNKNGINNNHMCLDDQNSKYLPVAHGRGRERKNSTNIRRSRTPDPAPSVVQHLNQSKSTSQQQHMKNKNYHTLKTTGTGHELKRPPQDSSNNNYKSLKTVLFTILNLIIRFDFSTFVSKRRRRNRFTSYQRIKRIFFEK